jgi:F0F1-type ATP synthase membrane subunit b/b'
MMDRGSIADGSAGEATTLGERAQEMRAGLAVRRQAEALLAEAGDLRKRAAADADAMVADAETMANELVAEARAESERTVAAGKERADGILARARAEADEIRDQMEQERARLREAAAAAVAADVDRAHERLTAAGPVLEGAAAAAAELLEALSALRAGDEPITARLERLAPQVVAIEQGEVVEGVVEPPRVSAAAGEDAAVDEAGVTPDGPEGPLVAEDGRPLGWLFRSGQA